MKRISLNNRIQIVLVACLLLFMGICFSINDTISRYVNEIYSVVAYESDAVYNWHLSDSDVVGAEKSGREIPDEPISSEDGAVIHQLPSENSPLILEIAYPEGCNEIAITLNGGTFPAGMNYSFDGIEKYQLNETGYIGLSGEPVLIMEFPEELLKTGENASLEFYFFGEAVEPTLVEIQIKKVTSEATGVSLQGTAKPILGKAGCLSWNITKDFADTTYGVELQYLSIDGYVEIPVADSLQSVLTTNDDGSVTIALSNVETNQALAGTYRMVVSQSCKLAGTTCQLQSIYIPFFVNYR